jgi:heme/copper-type cytochrome/quinol oxidase subunit 2
MRGTVVVEAESDFVAWLGEYSTFAQWMARTEPDTDNVLNLVAHEAAAAATKKRSAQ